MDDREASAFGNCTADFAETVLLVTFGSAESLETGWRGVSDELRRKDEADWKMAWILDWAGMGSTVAVLDTESVLCLTLSMLGLQSSGRARFFWEEAAEPGSLKTLRSTCDGALSLRGVEIEFTTAVAPRESLLEGAISEGDGGLCLSMGCKGENDGLEWTGLVGRGRESEGRTGLQKRDCCGKKQRLL